MGIIGLFVKQLQAVGFSSMQIVAIRVLVAFFFLCLIGFVKKRSQLNIKLRHLPFFVGTGIFSIVFFNWCYFTAIEEMSISIAVILLYTAPAFVIILSVIFLKENLTFKKAVGVVGTITGCFLITGLTDLSQANISTYGIVIGLGSGLGYALYTIFGKIALKHYQSFTITFYTFLLASLMMFPVSRLWETKQLLMTMDVFLYTMGIGIIPTVLAYILYTEGLKNVDGSIASILATTEPIVAVFIGVIAFNENLVFSQWVGAGLILLSAIYVNFLNNQERKDFYINKMNIIVSYYIRITT